MATIDSKEFIDKIIAANGRLYENDPPITRIVEYTNAWGRTAYGVVFQGEAHQDRYEIETEYVQNPKVIFLRSEIEEQI